MFVPVFVFTSGVFVRKFLSRSRPRHAGMGLSVSASRGAGDRAGTITLMCLALMFQALFLVTAARNRLRAPAHPLGAGVRAIAFFFAVAVLLGV